MGGSRLAQPHDKPGKRPGRHDKSPVYPGLRSSIRMPTISMTSLDRISHGLYQYICELYVLRYLVKENIMNVCLHVESS
jgi:hypothetical protein